MAKVKQIDAELRKKRQLAILNKVISDDTMPSTYDEKGNRKPNMMPITMANSVSNTTAQALDDVESIKQLLPETELVSQILISSILSPKDLSTPHPTFISDFEAENPEIVGKMLNIIEDYAIKDFGLIREMPLALNEMLITKGSYIHLIVPESSLDKLINGDNVTLESAKPFFVDNTTYVRPLGIIVDTTEAKSAETSITLQSFFTEPVIENKTPATVVANAMTLCSGITLTDNPDAVKIPNLIKKVKGKNRDNALSKQYMTMQARKQVYDKTRRSKDDAALLKLKGSDREIEEKLKVNRALTPEQVIKLEVDEDGSRRSIGHPLLMKLSPEALVPIHGAPNEHIAYILLLDQYGSPLNSTTATDHYRDLQRNFKRGNDIDTSVSNIISELRGGSNYGQGTPIESFQEAQRVFSELLTDKLYKRIRSQSDKDDINIAMSNAALQLMFARACKKKHTQMLYIPAEMVNYQAFWHTNHGVGKSLMESGRVLSSMRILLMIANLMTAVRNSTTETELQVNLDPTDSDPMSSIEMVVDSVLRTRADNLPLAAGDVRSTIDFLNRAGISIIPMGHPDLPEMRIEKNEKTRNLARPDTELMDEFRRLWLQNFGLTPEVTDAAKDVNLATSLVQSSLLLSKRVLLMQADYEPQVADLFKKIARFSEPIFTKLLDIVEAEGKGGDKKNPVDTVYAFIDSISISLPKPDTVTLEALMETYDKQTEAWTKGLDAYFSEEWVDTVDDPDLAEKLDQIKAATLAMLQRDWLRKHNALPELDALTEKDESGKPAYDFGEIHATHIDSLTKMLAGFMKNMEKAAEKREKAGGEGMDGGTDDAATDDGGEAPADDAGDEGTEPDDAPPADDADAEKPADDKEDGDDDFNVDIPDV